MKLTTFLVFAATLMVSASVYSQSTRLTLQFSEITYEQLFREIEKQTEFRFAFSKSKLDPSQKINLDVTDETLERILDKALPEGIAYEIIDRYVVILNAFEKASIAEIQQQLQQPDVSGTVTDEAGQPLPGVTVVVKGTTRGTVTNNDGNYSLTNIPDGATLQFSFVGMLSQEVVVGNQTTINVTMVFSSIGIEEVVAVGYGTMRKQEVTGSVSVADLEKYNKVPVTNIMETVKGTVPGLNVGPINSAGQVASFSIRGQNSIGASNAPLVVVDGVIFNGSIGDIAPDDIESFTVLKDASAAAIYGSRSANGVILIETKRGKGIEGKPVFNARVNIGFVNQLKPNETYNGQAYIDFEMDKRRAYGLPINLEPWEYLDEKERVNYQATPDHKPTVDGPFDAFLQNAYKNSVNFSFANSTNKSNYYISVNAVDEKGVIIGDKFKQISGRINIKSALADWFDVTVNSSYTGSDYSGVMLPVPNMVAISPYATLKNEDGSFRQYPQNPNLPNPHWMVPTDHKDVGHNLVGVITSEIDIPYVEGLTLTSTFSNNLRWRNNASFYDKASTQAGQTNSGVGSQSASTNYYMLFDNYLTYKRIFAGKHRVNATLLYSVESTTWNNHSLEGNNFANDVLGYYKLQDAGTQKIASGGGESSAIGQMGRVSYSYDDKYSLTATVRRDGFSGFSKNKKWGVFPSLGVSWNIIKEEFMQNSNTISNLALSASYGSVGNQAISPYSTLARVNTAKIIYAGSENNYQVTQSIGSFALNNLGWETTTGLNMGLDIGFLEDRISGRLDAYQTTTTNLIYNLSIPYILGGGSSIKDNIGEIRNKGIELTLNTVNIVKNDFQWSSSLNFSLNRNKVVTITGEDNDGDGIEDDLISSGIFIGKSLGTIYDYKVIGMWQQEDEDDGNIMTGMRPGDYKGEDLPYETTDENGNVIIEDPDGRLTSDKDRQFIGNSNPNFRWSLTNTLSYKNWTLMAYLYSIWGGNGWYQTGGNDPYFNLNLRPGSASLNVPIYDYWTPENTDAEFPRIDYRTNAAYRIRKYMDRSFIKLQKVALTYDFTDMVKPVGIEGLSCTLSADNLATYAPHWVGLDPETGQGVTATSLPSLRTLLFSVALNF